MNSSSTHAGRGLALMGRALVGLALALALVWLWYFSDATKIISIALLAIAVLLGVQGDEEVALTLLAPAHACLIGCWIMEMLAAASLTAALVPGMAIPLIALGGWRLIRQLKLEDPGAPQVMQDELFAHIGHELRTPLNALVCSAQLLDNEKLKPEQRKYVATLIAAGRVMTELLDNLLDISCLRLGGPVEISDSPVQVQDFVAELSEIWQASAQKKDLSWQCRLDPGVPEWLEFDPIRLRQILSNLISNAIRCTDQGGVSLSVSFAPEAVACDSGQILFEVADSGCGISANEQAALFSPFRKGERGGGMGLGLAICRGLSEALGGDLDVWSEEGQGSAFMLTVPCRRTEAVNACSEEAGFRRAKPRLMAQTLEAGDFSHLRMLIAEDHPAHRHILTTLLKAAGVTPVLVSNGAEALQCLTDETFDLALIDLRMPVMDGMETVRKIRRLDNDMANVPVIFLTAGVSHADRERLLDSGIAAILPKPVDTSSLYRVIAEVLAAKTRTDVRHPQFA